MSDLNVSRIGGGLGRHLLGDIAARRMGFAQALKAADKILEDGVAGIPGGPGAMNSPAKIEGIGDIKHNGHVDSIA